MKGVVLVVSVESRAQQVALLVPRPVIKTSSAHTRTRSPPFVRLFHLESAGVYVYISSYLVPGEPDDEESSSRAR